MWDEWIVDHKIFYILRKFGYEERKRVVAKNWDSEDAFLCIQNAVREIIEVFKEVEKCGKMETSDHKISTE